MRNSLWLLAAVGSALLLVAILGSFSDNVRAIIQQKLDEAIRQNVVWSPSSPPMTSARFQNDTNDLAPPILMSFYFFNISNLMEVRRGGRPVLQELGPYTFLRHQQKLDIIFNASTVSFKQYNYYVGPLEPGHPALSQSGIGRWAAGGVYSPLHRHGRSVSFSPTGGPQPPLPAPNMSDRITTLNLPLAGALETIVSHLGPSSARWLELLAGLIDSWKDKNVQGLFTTRTVEELLFGYEDPLLKQIASVVPFVKIPTRVQLVANMTGPEDALALEPNVVNTGAHNLSHTWDYQRWNGLKRITSWAPGHTEHVHGSDGLQFPPGIVPGQRLAMWLGDIFRCASSWL